MDGMAGMGAILKKAARLAVLCIPRHMDSGCIYQLSLNYHPNFISSVPFRDDLTLLLEFGNCINTAEESNAKVDTQRLLENLITESTLLGEADRPSESESAVKAALVRLFIRDTFVYTY